MFWNMWWLVFGEDHRFATVAWWHTNVSGGTTAGCAAASGTAAAFLPGGVSGLFGSGACSMQLQLKVAQPMAHTP